MFKSYNKNLHVLMEITQAHVNKMQMIQPCSTDCVQSFATLLFYAHDKYTLVREHM